MQRETWQITSRQEWLERRKGLLTASRIAALFSCHPYMRYDELAASLAGDSHGDTPAMRRGRIMESAIIEAMREDHPEWTILKATSFHTLPEHKIGATPDAFFDNGPDDQGLIQCKTVSEEVWEKWKQRAPLGYQLQTLTEMMCTDMPRGILAVMVMSRSLPVFEFEIPRHPTAEQRILDAAARWWTAYDAGELAAPADDEGLAALLDNGSHIDLSDNNYLREALPARQQLKEVIGTAEKRVAEIDTAIKDAMGAASTATLPGYLISFKSQTRKERLVPASTFRSLRVRSVGEQEEEAAQ